MKLEQLSVELEALFVFASGEPWASAALAPPLKLWETHQSKSDP